MSMRGALAQVWHLPFPLQVGHLVLPRQKPQTVESGQASARLQPVHFGRFSLATSFPQCGQEKSTLRVSPLAV
jgi:hypothetical protein